MLIAENNCSQERWKIRSFNRRRRSTIEIKWIMWKHLWKKCFDDNYHSTTFINSFVVLYSINFSREESSWLVCFTFDSLEEQTYVFFASYPFNKIQLQVISCCLHTHKITRIHIHTQAKNIHAPSTSFRSPENYQKLLKSII